MLLGQFKLRRNVRGETQWISSICCLPSCTICWCFRWPASSPPNGCWCGPACPGEALHLLGRIDGAYGGIAMAVIVVGICRVIFGLKGWEYYVSNHAFWGKMAAFVVVGLLSIRPTMRILAWRRAGDATPSSRTPRLPPCAPGSRREIAFFALILVFAAMMARGFGY